MNVILNALENLIVNALNGDPISMVIVIIGGVFLAYWAYPVYKTFK